MNFKVLLIAAAFASVRLSANAEIDPANKTPLTVKNLPYSGEEVFTTTRTSADGKISKQVHRENVSRNSAGSVRREYLKPGKSTDGKPGILFVEIHDEATRHSIHLDPATKTETVTSVRWSKRAYAIPVFRPYGVAPTPGAIDLGSRTIDGLSLSGSRTTTVFPAGTVDKDQPVTSTEDTWYSPDLKLIVLKETHDTLGNSSVDLIKISGQTEPDISLFQAPADYTVSTANVTKVIFK